MPSTLLFAVNKEGRAFALSTGNSAWREFLYLGLEFKKLSAVPHFIWAIGGDRQVYLHVHSLDVPIRVKEICYENERWYPTGGWSQTLLPTDRPRFSTEDGLVDRDIDKVRLPSMAWQWDAEWALDCTFEGGPLDHDGWMYAVDFPRTYHSKMAWSHCVRRRKWIRFRRYSALNSWCAIAPLHKDPTQEPFIDVAIGGNFVPSADPGLFLVWAVTSHGRVMYRASVSTTAPEGLKWTAIPTPSGCEVSQISVGPTGMIWAALHNGRALARSGVTRDSLIGKSWLEVKPPGSGLKITQVSVGTNSVWCITNDNKTWFRRGVQGAVAGISEDATIGNGWVEMVGNICSISVAANDQVFAVGSEDRALYYRAGVTSADLTGKKWKLIHCQMQMSRTSSDMSLSSRKSGSTSPKRRSMNSLKYQPEHSISINEDDEEQSRSAPTANINRQKPELWQKPTQSPAGPPQPNIPNLPSSLMEKESKKIMLSHQVASSCPIDPIYEVSGKHLKNPHAWSPVRSVGSVVGIEAHPEADAAVFESEGSNRDSGVFGDDCFAGAYWAECDVMWSGVAAGAVTLDPNHLPHWFNDMASDKNEAELTQPWRLQILGDLKSRIVANEFSEYEKANDDMSSWVKSGEVGAARVNMPFEDCLIELEWISVGNGMDSGTLTILNSDGVTTKMQFPLNQITCVMCCSEPGHPRFAIHAPRLPIGSSPLRLQFSGDSDMEDWLAHLASVCCQINEVSGKPSNSSIWTTSSLGDVFVFDPTNLKAQQLNSDTKNYRQIIDLSATETPYSCSLDNGLPLGSRLSIKGCVYDDADQIRFDLQSHSTVRVRHKSESFRNMPFHLNPRFHEKCIVMNSMEMSSWESEIRDSRMVFSPGTEFELIIVSQEDGFKVIVNGFEYTVFKYRGASPDSVYRFHCSGRVKLFSVEYETPTVIVPLNDVFWRQVGGHLKRVETCKSGITWGVGYDNTAWVYTGGWGGFLKGLETSSTGINPMSDTHNFFIYENQRWNPISGFSTAALPTDRFLWSDVTGKHKRSKEYTKLLSMHWQWISEWIVDFHTPGGVDRDGWQYAVDFPASYHPKKQFTDYVRRRRWFRKCKLNTKGPWQEVGNTRLLDVSLQTFDEEAITLWAISSNGDCLYRLNVTQTNPTGTGWIHLESDQPFVSISCSGENGTVWAVGKNGIAYYRFGITQEKQQGESWQTLESPSSVSFKQISAGKMGVWALDKESNGRLAVRREISATFPEGSHWQLLPNIVNDSPNFEGNMGFKCISVGNEVMAISNSGYVCKRMGVTKDNPAGSGWNLGILGNWQHVSVNGF